MKQKIKTIPTLGLLLRTLTLAAFAFFLSYASAQHVPLDERTAATALDEEHDPNTEHPESGGEPRAALGHAFTYQGQLKNAGVPVSGDIHLRFSLWDDPAAGTQLGSTLVASPVAATDGLFTVNLDFGMNTFNGEGRWLMIEVCDDGTCATTTPLTPRQSLTPAPHALALPGLFTQQNATSPNVIGGRADNAVTADAVGATISGGGAGGSNNNRATENYATVGGGRNNQAGNNNANLTDAFYATVGGGDANTASNSYATVAGGRSNSITQAHATIGGGRSNSVSAQYGTIAGGGPSDTADVNGTRNRVTDQYGSIGGGGNNQAGDSAGTVSDRPYATVSGGEANIASGDHASVAGGLLNTASNSFSAVVGGNTNQSTGVGSFVGGGTQNQATGNRATVAGGVGNVASGQYAFVGGGGDGPSMLSNQATALASTVCGGVENQASQSYATVGGGQGNIASAVHSAVGGGVENDASGYASAIAGGVDNDANGAVSTVAGGESNWANGNWGTVGGGWNNTAHGSDCTVGGGFQNTASGNSAIVGGGRTNTASGNHSTVPGGNLNVAGGNLSLAAGYRAKVRIPAQVGGGDTDGDQGTFVWADSTETDFESTGPDQFLIRATGGVGINKNNPATGTALDVNGTTQTSGFRMPTGAAANRVLTSDAWGEGSWQAVSPAGRLTASASFGGLLPLVENPSSTNWVFVGPTADIVLAANQRLQVVGSAALGTFVAGGAQFHFDVGYQLQPGGTIIGFAGGNYLIAVTPAGLRSISTISGHATSFAAGTYRVGIVVRGTTNQLNFNDYCNLTYMVFGAP